MPAGALGPRRVAGAATRKWTGGLRTGGTEASVVTLRTPNAVGSVVLVAGLWGSLGIWGVWGSLGVFGNNVN